MSDARTPGQVAYLAYIGDFPTRWTTRSDHECDLWEALATAVIAHHVGPDRVVVDRADVLELMDVLYDDGQSYVSERIRKALK